MSTEYLKISGKMRIALIIKSLIFGISLGIASASVYAIVMKLLMKAPSVPISIIVGVLAGMVSITVPILIFLPTQKRLAKSLDKKLALGEKVQTMVEFDGRDGEMLEVQRQDTHRIIKETPKNKFNDKKIFLHAIAPIAAIAILLTAVFMGERKPENQSTEPSLENAGDAWELTDWHITGVQNLINDVKGSQLADEGKVQVVATLEGLLVELKPVKSKAKMKEIVIAAMVEIDETIDGTDSSASDGINSFSGLKSAMANSPDNNVKLLGSSLYISTTLIDNTKYNTLIAEINTQTAADALAGIYSAIKFIYDSASEKEKSDSLYIAVYKFAEDAKTLSDGIKAGTVADRASAVQDLFTSSGNSIKSALEIQKNNRDVGDTAINQLMKIFEIDYTEIPDSLKYNNEGEIGGVSGGDYDKEDDDESQVTDGGKGTGETIYASDDEIYYKDAGKHVSYGTVIDEYNTKRSEAEKNPDLSDEVIDAIDKYFANLYNSKNKE